MELSNARAEQRNGGGSYNLATTSRTTSAPPGSARAEAERRRYSPLLFVGGKLILGHLH